MINFNPRLRAYDSLSPEEIAAKAERRNAETRELTEKAYLISGVPPSSAAAAADHSSVTRQTAEAKKTRKDAAIWSKAKNSQQFRERFYEENDNA